MDFTNLSGEDKVLLVLLGVAVIIVVFAILKNIIKPSDTTAQAPEQEEPAPTDEVAQEPTQEIGDREKALIMAIVADELKKDPRELNFISIKEVK